MGVVYRALDPLLERVVALKTISAHLDSQPELRARFFREGRSAAHLSHRNIITVYDIGEDSGVAYLAMECLEGQDLKATITKRIHFSLQRKLAIVMDVCEGLAHAHSRQVIHRDVKPANIFVTISGEVKILDFGLARMVAGDITHTGAPLGTPNYMSPEQVRGERADHRSDIFSVGAVLYELLVLRRAFDGDSVPATIMKILQADPEAMEKSDPSIDAALSDIVMRALAKDPDARYQRVDDLLGDLRQFSSSLPPPLEENNREILFDATRPRPDAVPELPTIETPAGQSSLPISEDRRRLPSVVTMPSTAPSVEPPARQHQVAGGSPAGAVPGASRGLLWGGIAAFLVLLLSLSLWWVRRKPEAAPVSESLTAQSRSPSASDTSSNRADRAQAREAVPPVASAPPPPVRPQIAEENRKEGAEAPAPRASEKKEAPADRRDPGAVQARLDAAAKTAAEDALGQMIQSRTKAENTGAPQLATNSYEAARRIETEARALYDGGQYQRAGARFYETSGLYTSAALEAASQKETRARLSEQEHRAAGLRSEAELSRQYYEQVLHGAQTAGAQERAPSKYQEASGLAVEAQSAFSQQDYSGARSHWDAAGAAMDQARAAAVELARTPVAPPDDNPPKPVPPSAESERQLVATSLQRYGAALQAKDLAALKAVWPGLNGKQEEAIRHEFSNARDIHVQLVDIEIRVTGDSATAAARRIYQLQTLDGQKLEIANRAILSLHRSSGTWLIDRIRFEPLR